jgi:hypothetical protein
MISKRIDAVLNKHLVSSQYILIIIYFCGLQVKECKYCFLIFVLSAGHGGAHLSVVPATQEAEAGGSFVPRSLRPAWATE